MKKLLLLFLAVAGYVSSANADYYVIGNHDKIGNWSFENAPALVAEDGIYKITVSDVVIPSDNFTLEYKITADKKWDAWQYNNEAGGSGYNLSNNATYTIPKAGTYDITFMLYPSGYTSYGSTYFANCSVAGEDLYVIYQPSGGDWTVGDKLTTTTGTYTANINATEGMVFALAPAQFITGGSVIEDAAWKNLIRPISVNWYDLYVQHMSAKTLPINNDKIWYFKEAATYTFTYYGKSNSFVCEAQATSTIGSEGWRTYSTGTYEGAAGYTISGSDVAAYYVSATGEGKATLAPISGGTVIPTKAGIMLKGSGSFTVTTVATDGVTLTGNLLVGSGSKTGEPVNVPTSTGYVLGGTGSTLGFYHVDASNVTIGANKAYLNVPGAAHVFFGLDDESTGINDVNVEKENAPIYNLQGIRLAQPQKGLNIINGKKVLTK